MTTQPIPDAALDDRLAFIGTAGSGKTYTAKGRVERLLQKRHRVVVVDPLDVWFGLRLSVDGKHGAYRVAILGGRHADLPLTEHSGALIGEAVARSTESCIVSLTGLRTSAQRQRFMLAFLDALYERTNPDASDPYHVVFDEADLWAPQKPMGNEAMLCHLMEEIVRRGRVKGFIPWLITQRPAVLNKNVLSQADGLIALKLTSSQDRDAIGAWIEGQADRQQGKHILASLPTLSQGQGIVWIPGRGILSTEAFPENATFDSSRTPKRGEKKRTTTLKPLDIAGLKDKLATVEAETKANDPKALKAKVAELTAAIAKLQKAAQTPAKVAPDKDAIAAAEARGFEQAKKKFGPAADKAFKSAIAGVVKLVSNMVREVDISIIGALKDFHTRVPGLDVDLTFTPTPTPRASPALAQDGATRRLAVKIVPPVARPSAAAGGDATLSGPQRQLLQSLAWWKAMGHEAPTRVQVASICGWRITSGHLKNVSGSLRSAGFIDYPSEGTLALTATGEAAAPAPNMSASLEDSVRAIMTGPQRQAFDVLPQTGEAITREQLAESCGWNITGGHVKNVLGSMRSLEVIDYPSQGAVARAEWLRAA